MSFGSCGVIHLIGHIIMMHMYSFNFGLKLRVLELIYVPHQSRDTFILKYSTLYPRGGRLLESNGVSGVIHLIGHIFMMQMDSFNFGLKYGF